MSCQLIVYGGGGDSDMGDGVGDGDCCSGRADPVLDLVSNSSSKLIVISL